MSVWWILADLTEQDRKGLTLWLGILLVVVVVGCVLILLIRKLGAKESSAYAALFVVAASLMPVYVAATARDNLTLQQRGEKVTATVARKY